VASFIAKKLGQRIVETSLRRAHREAMARFGRGLNAIEAVARDLV